MSTTKLLSRIVAPENMEGNAARMHDHTYGITSDPLTHFSAIFSALIHDLDHPGVPNITLVNEKSPQAQFYNNISVAEQNSVDLAFQMLMEKDYDDLRRAIYTTTTEYKRFRQLVVNLVLATDVMDKSIGLERKVRWNKAFSGEEQAMEKCPVSANNRKATIVLERKYTTVGQNNRSRHCPTSLTHSTLRSRHTLSLWLQIWFKRVMLPIPCSTGTSIG